MAKFDDNIRRKYNNNISPYLVAAQAILGEEEKAAAAIKQNKPDSALKRLEMVEAMLNLASNYIVINGISQSVLDQKNEDALNEARKSLNRSIVYLEETVSNYIDASFSDYQNKLAAIESFSPVQRYSLVRKMGLTIDLLKNAFGDNFRWKWAFVELEGRYAVVAKNLLDLRTILANSDPRSPNYEPTVYHLRLARKLLMQSADRYREKYELSTNRFDDFKRAVTFLMALKRLNTLTGAQHDTTTVQKKLDTWMNKLKSDMNKHANAKRQ